MRKIIIAIISLMVSIGAMEAETVVNASPQKLRVDTIYRTDTIHIREIISRDDVVHRTERVVRYYSDEPFNEIENAGTANPQSNSEIVIPGIALSPSIEEDMIEIESTSVDESRIVNEDLVKSGGKYVWVPDSMDGKVQELLTYGEIPVTARIKNNEEEINPYEKVLFRGDTINMVLKDRNLGRYDRGLFNFLFIPKGIWQVGLTASYGEFSTANLEILDLISDIDFSGKLWSIRPYFSYFIKSNLSLGLRLGYTEGKASIGSFNLDIDEDMSFSLHDIMYKSNSYSASITFSQYLGIARKGRFGVFNEVELALSGGTSDFHRPFNGEMRKTHTTTFQAALNFSPGVCVYVLDQVSFNVSLGVFGLNIKNEKQKVNDEDLGQRTTSGANFRFNIFNINFGIAVNI